MSIEYIEKEMKKLIEEAYEEGFVAGQKVADYKEGAQAAWRLSGKIVNTVSTDHTMNEIFGDDFYYNKESIFNKYTAEEAMKKVDEYTEKMTELYRSMT